MLLHSDTLKTLAAEAEASTRSGALQAARAHWMKALDLLPAHSQQHATIRSRVDDLTTRITAEEHASGLTTSGTSSWLRGLGGIGRGGRPQLRIARSLHRQPAAQHQ